MSEQKNSYDSSWNEMEFEAGGEYKGLPLMDPKVITRKNLWDGPTQEREYPDRFREHPYDSYSEKPLRVRCAGMAPNGKFMMRYNKVDSVDELDNLCFDDCYRLCGDGCKLKSDSYCKKESKEFDAIDLWNDQVFVDEFLTNCEGTTTTYKNGNDET